VVDTPVLTAFRHEKHLYYEYRQYPPLVWLNINNIERYGWKQACFHRPLNVYSAQKNQAKVLLADLSTETD
jgi:hypothetical protein